MDFHTNRKMFQLAVQRCLNIVERRATQPCLSNILLRTEEDAILLTSTDMELSIHTRIPADIVTIGEITVAARTLFDLLREWSSVEQIQVVLIDQRLELRSGRSLMRLNTISAAEYPAIKSEIQGTDISVPTVVLSEMIASTQFSISDDQTRLHLTGLLFEYSRDHGLRLVSTDAHRLSFCQFSIDTPYTLEAPLQVIVPKKTIQEFKRLCDEFDQDTAQLTLDSHHVLLRVGVHVISSKVVDARYPLYEEVLPKENSLHVRLPKREFDQILRRFIILANEFTHDIRTTFADNALHVVTINKEQELAEDFLAITYQGETINVGMNARYMRDVLAVLHDDHVEMELEKVKAPILIREQALGIEKKFIVMPLDIQ
ncbi:MAG: DNA polymerase III subunit beta [Mariprofundales bacterium]